MQINSWNCRGLGNPLKDEAVKYLLKMNPTDMLLLQETKIEDEALLSISRTKWNKNTRIVASARGTSGGLDTLWSEENFLLQSSHSTHHWIFSELQHLLSKTTISLFNLYVPVNYLEKRICWQTLSLFLENHDL